VNSALPSAHRRARRVPEDRAAERRDGVVMGAAVTQARGKAHCNPPFSVTGRPGVTWWRYGELRPHIRGVSAVCADYLQHRRVYLTEFRAMKVSYRLDRFMLLTHMTNCRPGQRGVG